MTITKSVIWSAIAIGWFHIVLYALELMARYSQDFNQYVGL